MWCCHSYLWGTFHLQRLRSRSLRRLNATEGAEWVLVADFLLAGGAVMGAVLLRVETPGAMLPTAVPAALVAMAIQPSVNAWLGLHRQLWPYAGPGDYAHILFSVLVGTTTAAVVYHGATTLGAPIAPWPISLWIIAGLLALVLMGGLRYAIRLMADWGRARAGTTSAHRAVPTLLFGAGEAGAAMARSSRAEPRAAISPVGFLDDDPVRHGRVIARLPVLGGLDRLEEAVGRTKARQLLITMPNASGSRVREVVEVARAAGIKVQTVPPLWEMLDGSYNAFRVRDIRVEDLLRREPLTARGSDVDRIIRGGQVMITGAGGSIGSELARQVFAMRPEKLILIDRAEGSLFAIEQELQLLGRRGKGGGLLSIHLANVASRAVMFRIMQQTRPTIVFHAAAHKHVPMMEQHPADAVQVNVGGTMSVLDAALAHHVQRFVFVSTDKAVKPTSVMGASKRIGEALVAQAAHSSGLPYVSVRFGNVLGSSGSVVPIFKKQLEDGEPLTITDPEMTRYFMTIPEAVWLILDAASFGGPGDLLVLDMGEPVRIVDIARDLIRLAGRDPDSVPIEFVGMRPGEKLKEELFYDREGVTPTANPRVLLASGMQLRYDLRPMVAGLLEMATGDADDSLRRGLFGLVSSFERPNDAPVRDWAADLHDKPYPHLKRPDGGSTVPARKPGHRERSARTA